MREANKLNFLLPGSNKNIKALTLSAPPKAMNIFSEIILYLEHQKTLNPDLTPSSELNGQRKFLVLIAISNKWFAVKSCRVVDVFCINSIELNLSPIM